MGSLLQALADLISAAPKKKQNGPMFWGNPAGASNFAEAGYDVLMITDEPDTWMTPENEKKLVKFANSIAKSLGLNEPCIGFTLNELHDGNAIGVFIGGTESDVPTMVLDVSAHRSSSDITDTVAHELAHAFQWTQLSHEEWDLDDAEEIAEAFCRDLRKSGLKRAVELLTRACDHAINTAYGSSDLSNETVIARKSRKAGAV